MDILGIDDAGRGPVIGPLVMAGVMIKKEDESKLKSIGVKDSKMLSPKQREQMFKQIVSQFPHKIVFSYPAEIDDAVADHGLNQLEARKSIEIINALKPNIVVVDCPSTNIQEYKEFLENLSSVKCEFIAEHKADINYPVVSAASILAKVSRDKAVKEIEAKIGKSIGSGYPADPVTKLFIKRYFLDYPEIFRKSWVTYKKLVADKKQMELGEF